MNYSVLRFILKSIISIKECKVKGRKADVMLAAHYASEAALRLVVPGGEVMCTS